MKKIHLNIFIFLFFSQFIYSQDFNILVFHETNGFRHTDAINASISMLEEFGGNENHDSWSVTSTRDASEFSTQNLANYEVVVFSNTTGGALLNDDQKAAMENFIQNGGGFIGFHSATDTYRNIDDDSSWPWYNELVGAIVQSGPFHTSNNLPGTMNVLMDHPVVDHIGNTGAIWQHEEEWYYWEINGGQLSDTNENLLEVQETGNQSYDETRPITWLKEFDGGRSFYTALGHNAATYNDNNNFREMVEKAVLWAANRLDEDSGAIDDCSQNAPIGEIIALKKAGGDEKWVTLDDASNNLVANGEENDREGFLIEEHPSGCITLKSISTDLYVQVVGTTNAAITAQDNTSTQQLENFYWEQISANQVGLKSEFTDTWVQASWNQNNTSLFPLGQAIGTWETFDYVILDEGDLLSNENSFNEIASEKFTIYPNPVTSFLSIGIEKNAIIRIFNPNGKVLISKNIIGEDKKINLKNLQSGIYFAQIETESGIFNKRIIKK